MDIYRIFLLSSMLTLCSCLFDNTYAVNIPGTSVDASQVTPGNIARTIHERLPKALSTDKKLILPSLTHEIDLGEAKKYKFTLRKVNITGNKAVETQELEKLFKPYYGRTVTLAKVLELVENATTIYHEREYVLSQAYLPAQSIDKNTGVIEIAVVEGFIHEVSVVSDTIPHSTKVLLQQYGDRLKSERPITKSTIERYALLANDLPGGDIKVVFSPSADMPGAADVDFVAENNKMIGLDVFTNNRGTRLLGPEEYSSVLYQYNGMYGNKTTLNYVRSDVDKMRYYLFNHRQPLNSDGLVLTFGANRTETQPDFNALPQINRTAVETPGSSDVITLQLEYPFIRSRAYNLVGTLNFFGSDNETKFPETSTILFKERLRVLRAGLNFDWLDTVFFGILSTTLIGGEFSQGIDGLNALLPPAQTTRPNVRKDFKKVTGLISRTQPLLPGLTLNLLGTAQHAFDELVSSEEFGYGGRIIGLGYDGFQISGDHGISGKAELSYEVPLEEINHYLQQSTYTAFGDFLSSLVSFSIEGFAFYDGGKVWNKDYTTSGQKQHDSAVSRGGGVRGQIFKYISYEGYIADPATRVADNEDDRQPRYFFSVGLNYS